MSVNFSGIIESAQNKTNLKIVTPESSDHLAQILDNGLAALYIEVFSKPPYNELFTPDDVKKDLMADYEAGGLIFTAFNANGEAVAMVSSTPLSIKSDIVEIVGGRIDVDATSYFAEDMVRADMRRKGISNAMKSLLLEANHLSGYTHVLLRTTGNNYGQISAVSDAGAFTLKGVFQRVAQARQNGEIELDKRGFYMFATDPALEASVPQKLEDVAFVKPGGNDTALVFDSFPRDMYPEIGSRIMMTYPNIEQVMFVEKGDQLETRGQMAGGEFCGNATRAYAFVMADGKAGTLDVEVSGSDALLQVELTQNASCATMPIFPDLNSVKPLEDKLYHVSLNGISYIVAHQDHPYALDILGKSDDEQKKTRAKEILDQYGLSADEASGVIVLKRDENGTSIDPFVYVRDAGTLLYETACGSGSTAAALVISHETGEPVENLPILQPSGMNLVLEVKRTQDRYLSASVGGEVEILYRGSLNLSNEFKPQGPGLRKDLENE